MPGKSDEAPEEVGSAVEVEQVADADGTADIAPAVTPDESGQDVPTQTGVLSEPKTYDEYAANQDQAFQEQVVRTKAAREASDKLAAEIERQREEELERAAAALRQ